LRTLAERAKEIARGDYKQRVDASSPDEIGALGREFNAMAAALDEREQRLIRSERLAAVGKIAAQITHEVRNPLSSIGLNAEMLEEETEGEAKKLARAIVKEVDRLTEITEEYLRFARLPRPKLEREDLGAIVSSLLAFLRQELQGRGVRVEAQVEPSLPPVAADEHQLRQALLNLLRNAAEAMADGGQLTMTARHVPDGSDAARTIELIISDTGEGIAAEHLSKIFDPFFSTKEGGTGLGLALTQQIIVEHGGKIEVSSQPGRGTTFVVRLVAAGPAPAQTTLGARVA
jgi:signal transduction histidine kinase